MGTFKFEFVSVGGHGCQREAKEGEFFAGCGKMGCPDCECRAFVEKMKRFGMTASVATMTHWPDQEFEVVDNLSPEPESAVVGGDTYWHYNLPRPKRIRNDFFNSNPKKK